MGLSRKITKSNRPMPFSMPQSRFLSCHTHLDEGQWADSASSPPSQSGFSGTQTGGISRNHVIQFGIDY